ncbi:F-box only protein 42 isoform X2 [Parasteatoda tepidariorum]|uniref:F-box only protein 42 isoform X2 n=1 Tax=Parasteatoda tepidariorum TaxID=114398 RepID=UPI0039BCDAE6
MKDSRSATIEDLPDPIIEYILSYLSPYKDLKECMQVNKAWYRYVYDVIRKTQRDFYNAVCNMAVQWVHQVADPGPTISKRYSHSACCCENSMYIFGGCTTANTTFNDLWRLDLGTRCWIRPLATGTYPPPKACATLVNYGENLILFGGWTHTAPYPLHQVWRMFNQIHVYNTRTNRWTQITSATSCPAMAGHSATVHGDLMVVFGGLQRQTCDGPFQNSSDVWTLDLKTYKWQKQETTETLPPQRYGHSQLYTDIWLLKMNNRSDGLWEWQEMEVKSKENAAPHVAFHPACKVGSQVVVMSKTQRSRTSASSLPHLLRAPSRIWVPPRNSKAKTSKRPSSELDPCVNGKRGVLKRPADPRPAQVSSSDEDDTYGQKNAEKKSASGSPENSFSSSSCSSNNSSTSDSPSTSGHAIRSSSPPSNLANQNSEGAGPSGGSPPSGPFQNSSRPNNSTVIIGNNPFARNNRQRQLEGLDRMEQRIKDLKAGFPTLATQKVYQKPNSHIVSGSKNPMCLYVLDISTATTKGHVTWRPLKNESPSAPEEIILYSLVLGKGELIMFGGIQKDLNSTQQEGETIPEVVSNSLHYMTAERFVI